LTLKSPIWIIWKETGHSKFRIMQRRFFLDELLYLQLQKAFVMHGITFGLDGRYFSIFLRKSTTFLPKIWAAEQFFYMVAPEAVSPPILVSSWALREERFSLRSSCPHGVTRQWRHVPMKVFIEQLFTHNGIMLHLLCLVIKVDCKVVSRLSQRFW